MRRLILILLAAGLSFAAQAREAATPAEVAGYDYLIRAAWPHVTMRSEQRQWLATRSAVALRQCQLAGRTESHCRVLVREGLRETIGSEPVAAGLASNSW